MTKTRRKKFKCSCGNEQDVLMYDSVNIEIHPALKEKTRKRKINSFKCDNCKFEEELFGPFLYHDMANNLM